MNKELFNKLKKASWDSADFFSDHVIDLYEAVQIIDEYMINNTWGIWVPTNSLEKTMWAILYECSNYHTCWNFTTQEYEDWLYFCDDCIERSLIANEKNNGQS